MSAQDYQSYVGETRGQGVRHGRSASSAACHAPEFNAQPFNDTATAGSLPHRVVSSTDSSSIINVRDPTQDLDEPVPKPSFSTCPQRDLISSTPSLPVQHPSMMKYSSKKSAFCKEKLSDHAVSSWKNKGQKVPVAVKHTDFVSPIARSPPAGAQNINVGPKDLEEKKVRNNVRRALLTKEAPNRNNTAPLISSLLLRWST